MSAASPGPKARHAAARPVLAAIHYVPSGTAPACLPNDLPSASRRRKATGDAAAVTCRHCRETDAWQEASLFAGLEAYRTRSPR